MRFTKLKVENFKAITSAVVEFGPGLNVLYGPNDLGKSTLGQALKAVLLLQPSSAIAGEYQSWHEAVTPVVSLTFQDDDDKYWRVVKHFTENRASLAFSKDGGEFIADVNERAVDEKLRKLLGWGIPTPGGKGSSRGMPESFLANALLAAQTDVDEILSTSIEDDLEQSGKIKLTKALSALAQDPLVRHVLDGAQREYERYFTATGRRRSGQSAPLAAASDAVKKRTDELMQKQHALEQSNAIELEVKKLHDEWLLAQHRAGEVEQRLEKARAGLARASEKRAAEASLATEEHALALHEQLVARIKALDVEHSALRAQVQDHEASLVQAKDHAKAAAFALREAEDVHRKATSADGAAERAVARAQTEAEFEKLRSTHAELSGRLDKARAAKKAQDELTKLVTELERLRTLLGTAQGRQAEAERNVELIRGIMNYGAWCTTRDAVTNAEQSKAGAQSARAEAVKKTAELLALEQKAKSLEDDVTARRAVLPDDKQLTQFDRVRTDLDLAKAALGGGVTVTVRPKSEVLLRRKTDEGSAEETKIATELVLEADRRVQLSIGDLAEIEVITGAAEKVKEAERLRKKWETEVRPALERAEVDSLSELRERVLAQTERLEDARKWREQARTLNTEVTALRERAEMLDEKAAGAPSAAQLAEKERQIGSLDRGVLQRAFAGMKDWEAETRPQYEQSLKELELAKASVADLDGKANLTSHRLDDARAQQVAGPEDVGALETTFATHEQALFKAQTRLTQLEQEQGGAVAQSLEQLDLANAQLATAEQRIAEANDALTQSRAAESTKQGERTAIVAQVQQVDRSALVERVDVAKKNLANYADVEVLSDAEFTARTQAAENARARAEQAGRDFANAEGALSKVGGPQAREQVRQLQEALMVAKAEEHHLEVDAEAWRLLMDAVRESEKEDSSSLGMALAAPVTTRFAALTSGRYPSVQFDPALRAANIEVQGALNAHDVVDALSVGTRAHLATLVRLAIALQLKSAIVLDDHLVHTDLGRLAWFRDALHAAAAQTQVLVLTCRPFDYVPHGENAPANTRLIDLEKLVLRR